MVDVQHEVVWGSCPLVPANPSMLPYTVETTTELDMGKPEPVVADLASSLADGSLAEVLGYGNRVIRLRVEISGPTLDDLAIGEAALMVEIRRQRSTLRWSPPDRFAQTQVFEVVWSDLEYVFDDEDEIAHTPVRTFIIAMTCMPFARDEELTVVPSVVVGTPPTPVVTSVDACTSATGWAATYSPASGTGVTAASAAVSSGAIKAAWSNTVKLPRTTTLVSASLARSGLSVSMSSTPYLLVTVRSEFGDVYPLEGLDFLVNGVAVPVLATSGTVTTLDCSSIATLTDIKVTARHSNRSGTGFVDLYVDDVTRTNVPPSVGPGRQQYRSFTVGGTARTAASLQLSHPSTALNDVIIYIAQAEDTPGAQPSLRQYRTAGGTETPDTSTASGQRSPLNGGTAETYDVPAVAVGEGAHSLMTVVKAAAAGWKVITYTVSALVGSTLYGTRTESVSVYLPTTGWTIVELGRVTLPPVALPPGSTSKARITLSSPDSVQVDESMIFNTDVGALTWVKAGAGSPSTGGPSSRVWIDTPSIDRPRDAIWLGTLPDRSDARHAVGKSEVPVQNQFLIEPGLVNLYLLSLDATFVAAELAYYRRHMYNAARA